MPSITQVALVLVIISLTVLVWILGIEFYYILKEIRRSIAKVNKMLADMGIITESVAKPIANASEFITGIKSGVNLVSSIFASKEKEKDKDKDKEK